MDMNEEHTLPFSQENLDENFDVDIRVTIDSDEYDESSTITDIITHSLACL